MATPESLTEEDRAELAYLQSAYPERRVDKLLRIHDAQAERIRALERLESRISRMRDDLSFDRGHEEGLRIELTRVLNDQEPG